jgi:DtxR family Mn-dependent transcriptional regulator
VQPKYSIAEENYIKSIYHLEAEGNLSTGHLSEAMQTKPASVTDMLKKLKEKKLINWSPYKQIKLTGSGKKAALNIIRRHRLWEFFLSEKLQFGWDEVHTIAEELEHVSSEKLIDKLDEFLDYPRVDPHGDPIPDAQGNIILRKQIRLSDLAPGVFAEVVSVASQDVQLLEILNHFSINLGTQVRVNNKFEFDESLELEIHQSGIIHLSSVLAKSLFVTIL